MTYPIMTYQSVANWGFSMDEWFNIISLRSINIAKLGGWEGTMEHIFKYDTSFWDLIDVCVSDEYKVRPDPFTISFNNLIPKDKPYDFDSLFTIDQWIYMICDAKTRMNGSNESTYVATQSICPDRHAKRRLDIEKELMVKKLRI